jgi:diguanylate cyclase (GGDEF)-like protein/PAS domain S-box-containing protein
MALTLSAALFVINDNFVRNAFNEKYREITSVNSTIAEMILGRQSSILSNSINDIEYFLVSASETYLAGNIQAFEKEILKTYDNSFAKDVDIFFFVSADGKYIYDASSPFYDTSRIKNYMMANSRFLLQGNRIIQSESSGGILVALSGAAEAVSAKSGELAGYFYAGIVLNNSTEIITSIIESAKLSEAALIFGDTIIAGSTSKSNEKIIESCYNQKDIQVTSIEFYACTDISLDDGVTLKFYQSLPDTFLASVNRQNKRMGYITIAIILTATIVVGYLINLITVKSLYKLITYAKTALSGSSEPFNSSMIYEFNMLADNLATVSTELNSAQAYLKNLINNAEAPIAIWDRKGNITLFNTALEKLSGFTSGSVTGKHLSHIYSLFPNVNVPAVNSSHSSSTAAKFESPVANKQTGAVKHVLWNLTDIFSDGSYSGTILQGIDITERKDAEAKLLLASKVFENTLDGMLICDPKGKIISHNKALCSMTEYRENEMVGDNISILHCDKHPENFYKEIWKNLFQYGRWSGEVWLQKKTGITFPSILTISCIRNHEGSITNFINVVHDITERKQYEQRIEHQANHDSLTGLPNRLYFTTLLNELIQSGAEFFAVLFIDLDRFKILNDTLGHNTGDRVLEIIAERIRNKVTHKKSYARFGGDEFGVVIRNAADMEDAANKAASVIAKLSEPIIVQGYELFIQISAGMSFYPENGGTAAELVKNAEIAMFQAKVRGRNNLQHFTSGLDGILKERFLLESKLNRAIENNELSLHYQPKIDLAAMKVMGMEALLRWNNPELGNIPPDKFIHLAEETGLILPIGEWVMNKALEDTALLHAEGFTDLKIAVNLSLRQFMKKDLVSFVKSSLEKHNLKTANFEFEITENIFTEDLNTITKIMNEISSLGIKFAIDDFGTGYSSIGYLKKMPINTIKIDRSYINSIDTDYENERIVSSVILMSKSLGLSVVAEGAETVEQVELLKQMGCNMIQGYYFGHPMALDDFRNFVRDWQ